MGSPWGSISNLSKVFCEWLLGIRSRSPFTCNVYGPDLPGKCSSNPSWKEQVDAAGSVEHQPRERQYDHIKQGLLERGDSTELAEEIAARTVNKERARAGRGTPGQPDLPGRYLVGATRRPPLAPGPGRLTRDQLYEEARRRGIRGRSRMSKDELEQALDH